MIVEQRTYTLKAGLVPTYLKLYEAEGLKVQSGHLGHLVGYYSTEVGELNQIVHMWAYTDLADRERRRQSLFADPDWQALVPRLYEMIAKMENKLLAPAPFFSHEALA
jgi:hypothetical protein